MKNKKPMEKAKEAVKAYKGDDKPRSRQSINSDVTGSYTGTPIDGSHPEQDGDDI